jgi:hypothetical protein
MSRRHGHWRYLRGCGWTHSGYIAVFLVWNHRANHYELWNGPQLLASFACFRDEAFSLAEAQLAALPTSISIPA